MDAVGGEEENALEVLEEAKEDGDESVARYVLGLAGFKEDICFVKKEHRTPGMCHIKDLIEFGLELVRVSPELAYADHVERALEKLGDAFCRKGFTGAGWSVKNGYKTTALT